MPLEANLHQPSLPGFCPIEAAVGSLADASAESRGAVFTRREIVEFILDLVGYTTDKPLHRQRILEPAVGRGDFLMPTIGRLLDAYRQAPKIERTDIVADLSGCLHAVELHGSSFDQTRTLVLEALRMRDVASHAAMRLADFWLHRGDFLLLPIAGSFSHVVGNPPYVRQERIPDVLMAEYRRRYSTIYDRADIYIPFIERSLTLLAEHGQLGFICANRWLKNRYGGPLRRLVAERFHLKYFVDMVDTAAFHSDVIAYPAIVVIGREKPGATRVAARPPIEPLALHHIAKIMNAPALVSQHGVVEIRDVVSGSRPWMLDAPHHLDLVRRLEADYPTLAEAGCNVGIGVATGADHVFIAPFDALDVEPNRKLPIVMTRDILSGTVNWRGLGVVNPFGNDGKLVPLQRYPKLAAYLDQHRDAIKARHVSRTNPGNWYRTIDRIYPELTYKQKLLIPDIKGHAHIVYESGRFYPHHNLYFITSTIWNLHALQAVLLSGVTRMFIALYSTKMQGGYLRFQAQYLRRLRLPQWQDVSMPIRAALTAAGKARDLPTCNEVTAELYRLTPTEREALHSYPGGADVP